MTSRSTTMTLEMDPGQPRPDNGTSRLSAGIHDLNQQCLRILRCTARALATSPGGLRFKAGTRPWLEDLGRQEQNRRLLAIAD
jgi:hypothetical protein